MQDLLALAARQFGTFSRAQARRYGVTDRMLRYRIETGALERIGPSVYRVAGAPRSWHQSVMAASLGGGAVCVASHRTAAVLHGYDGFRPGRVEVTVPRTVRYRCSGITVHQSLDLERCDISQIGPIPVTSAERTLIDLGAVATWRRVEDAFDGAERDTTADRRVVSERHRQIRRQGRNGVGPMAIVLDGRLDAIPRSVIERAFLRLLDEAGLPPPLCQHPVLLGNGRMAYLDAAYADRMLGFEIDGHGSHATRSQRAADNRRARQLEDLGWKLRRFTYEEVMRDGPSVVRAVRTALNASFGVVR